jgi:SAM-dependent methyltransferase
VIDVGVHIEETCARRERLCESGDDLPVAPFGDVGNRLEGEHGRTLRAVKEYYDRRAPEYDDWWLGEGLYAPVPKGWSEERDQLMAALEALPARLTLDIACGTGFVTNRLRGQITGLDHSHEMLEVARRRNPDATFVQGDALSLPFENDGFERVFASHFYGHLEDEERQRFLAEARRVAPELVIVDAALHGGVERDEWQVRVLKDGSRWKVFKRFFNPETLMAELGGASLLHAGRWFVAVRSPAVPEAAQPASG